MFVTPNIAPVALGNTDVIDARKTRAVRSSAAKAMRPGQAQEQVVYRMAIVAEPKDKPQTTLDAR
jgi:hypothetical protein